MTIQPEWYPLLRWRTTLATTPSPRMIRIAVRNSSARRADMVGRAGRAMGILRASAGDSFLARSSVGNSRLYWLVLPGCDGAVSAPADNRNGAVLSGPGHRGDSRLVILIPMRLGHPVWGPLLGVVDRWGCPPRLRKR